MPSNSGVDPRIARRRLNRNLALTWSALNTSLYCFFLPSNSGVVPRIASRRPNRNLALTWSALGASVYSFLLPSHSGMDPRIVRRRPNRHLALTWSAFGLLFCAVMSCPPVSCPVTQGVQCKTSLKQGQKISEKSQGSCWSSEICLRFWLALLTTGNCIQNPLKQGHQI